MYLLIYVLFFLVWLIINVKNHGFNSVSYIILLFLLSSICSVVLLNINDYYEEDRVSIIAIFYHIFLYILFFLPLTRIGNQINDADLSKVIKYENVKPLLIMIIVLSICTIASSIGNISTIFSIGDIKLARTLYNNREVEYENLGLITYLGGIGNCLSFSSLFLCCYLYLFYPEKKTMILMLFISSFSIVFYNLAAMGRDGMVRWLLFLGFNFFFFKKHISWRLKMRIVKWLSIPLMVLLYLFFLISDARFGNRNDTTLVVSLFDYFGQQNIYFSYGFYQFMDGVAGGHINFHYFLGNKVSINDLNEQFYADYHLNTFSSFIGSLYFDLGLFKLTIFAIAYFIVFFTISFRKVSFNKIVIYLVLAEIIILGLFYYMFYVPTRINTIFLMVTLSYFITLRTKKII